MVEYVYSQRFDRISPLQQVVLILKSLNIEEGTSNKLALELGLEEQKIRMCLVSLEDMHWIKEKNHQLWSITEKGDVWLRNIEDAIETA